jgi:GNAT superfamily N-acetyltransferase
MEETVSARGTDRLDGEVVVAHERALDAASLERFQVIYLESFPPVERAPCEELVKEIESGRYQLLTVRRRGTLRGFAVSTALSGQGVHLLAYLAVEKPYRSQGLGGRLVQALVGSLAAQGDVSGLLIEVDPQTADDGRDLGFAGRRMEFYRRLGAQIVDAPGYRAPNLAGEGSLAMDLMWLPIRNPAQKLAGERLRECVVALLVQGYGLAEKDLLVRNVLQGLVRSACPGSRFEAKPSK